MAVGPNGEKLGLKIDWLNFTIPVGLLDGLLVCLKPLLGEFKLRGHGIHSYKESSACEAGGLLAWSEGRPEALCSLNADAWDMIPQGQKLLFLRGLVEEFGAKVTRIDCTLDDYHQFATLEDVQKAAAVRNFSGFLHSTATTERNGVELVGGGQSFGRAGKDGSGKYLLVYDKSLESKGEVNSVRYEARFYKDYAEAQFQNLVQSDDEAELLRKVGRAVGGVIDFVERGTMKDVKRMPRLPWWQALRSEIGEAKLSVPKVIPPLHGFAVYYARNIAPSVAMLRIMANSQGVEFSALHERLLDSVEHRIAWSKRPTELMKVDFGKAWFDDERFKDSTGRDGVIAQGI